MDFAKLRNMRMKQIAIINALLILLLFSYFLVIQYFSIKSSHLFIFLGMVILIQAVYGLLKGDSTKSLIPTFEKIAVYEKEKMGTEWYKQRKVNHFCSLIVSAMLFINSYFLANSSEEIFGVEPMFMVILGFVLLLSLNTGIMIHIKKVDRSTSAISFNGYTWKASLIGVAIGIVLAIVIIMISFSSIFLSI